MINLHLIERQTHWRIAVVHLFARLMGVLAHVEGIPFGSSRSYWKNAPPSEGMGDASSTQGTLLGKGSQA